MDINALLQSIALGLIQGLTEFIPVSSSGHVDVIPQILGWATPSTMFILFLHLGTLIALLVYFRQKLWNYAVAALKATFRKEQSKEEVRRNRELALVILAAVPAGLIGYLTQDLISIFYDDPANQTTALWATAAALILLGFVFLFNHYGGKKEISELPWWKAVLVGAAQCLAFVRGTSRSGITLIVGQIMGMTRAQAAEFSFLISIPILVGTSALSIKDLLQSDLNTNMLAISFAGMITAAVSGYLAIRFLLKYLQRNDLKVFGIYRICFGIFLILILLAQR